MKISLNKYIASCGVCSRRKADELISYGEVLVNGKLPNDEKYVDTEKDKITYLGKEIKPEEKLVYIMLNKPTGYLSSVTDDRGRKTVLDIIDIKERIYPVGRLDYNSSGLIILTNDGELTNELTHPKHHLPKEYVVKVDLDISDGVLETMQNGIYLDGVKTLPAKVKRIRTNEFSITLYEGKNRQIRRMCESLGFKVQDLRRIRIGNLKIGDLALGEFKYINKSDFF